MRGAPILTVQAQADIAFAERVCKLLDKPFDGTITFGGADGCEWGMSDTDGVTIESEKIRSTATPTISKEELNTIFDVELKAYQERAQAGVFKLEPLRWCEGGWQITSAIRPEHPVRSGFYRCNKRLVNVETEGVKAVSQFDHLAAKMVDLVR